MTWKQLAFALPHRTAMDREDFMVAKSNETAVAWLDAWPDWPSHAAVIYGPKGCGKTHLAHVWQKASDAIFITKQMLSAPDWLEQCQTKRAVIIDDVSTLAGNGGMETKLFHLFNLARETGQHILMLAEKAPKEWGITLPDLRSRVLATPAIEVSPPDDELLGAIFMKLFSDRQIRVDEALIWYLLKNCERSFEAASHMVDILDAAAMEKHKKITVQFVKQVLELCEHSST